MNQPPGCDWRDTLCQLVRNAEAVVICSRSFGLETKVSERKTWLRFYCSEKIRNLTHWSSWCLAESLLPFYKLVEKKDGIRLASHVWPCIDSFHSETSKCCIWTSLEGLVTFLKALALLDRFDTWFGPALLSPETFILLMLKDTSIVYLTSRKHRNTHLLTRRLS